MRLEVKNIHKSFGEKHVLNDVSFGVESGQALGLLGRNGAGKTTMLRIIMGVFDADSGGVLVDGQPIDRRHIKIGYLPEERGLYPKKIIRDQLQYFAALKGMAAPEARKAAAALLERLEMSEYAGKKLDVLSKGNQQKIQLAVALLNNPDILILDEPFSGLDPVNAMILKDVVTELIGKGKLVLFSSHQMNYTEEFCRDIAILNGGRIALSGAIREIRRSYERRTVVLSSPEAEKVERFIAGQASDITEKTERRQDAVTVTLASADKKMALLKRLAEQELNLDAFAVYEPSLNDIFVEYTEARI
ncbi:ABC-2 type transport system ATP-binding protein [Sporobacter termitidis DSM 10068]|uniref:ABC-2 type transport system ATP-binding protein n=1 Tax=Sporobacter termitidis DSM 10068 TaxID=1123282 RepID=A0A1M5Y0W1_9FIRM|nr:ATP-binding cassette domain-containing protein [Sporobacter termitidis]SHI05711.1 ABC-2 type transport system ATP-binding protein [Sporobacter termitidis DSM 10068]